MPTITKAAFGETKEGAPVDLYHLENKHGLKAQIMTFGATLRLMSLPNEQGETVNITLSRETLDQYTSEPATLAQRLDAWVIALPEGNSR